MRNPITSQELRHRRRYLHERNKQWSKELTEVPRDEWPPTYLVDSDAAPIRLLRSREFIVQVYRPEHGAQRLSICRAELASNGDWKDGITWDDLQRLKREAGFGDRPAVEIYPPDAAVVNVANLRHLWVLDAPMEFQWNKEV